MTSRGMSHDAPAHAALQTQPWVTASHAQWDPGQSASELQVHALLMVHTASVAGLGAVVLLLTQAVSATANPSPLTQRTVRV